MARKRKLPQPDVKMDLTPMIDVIFLLIIFFILAGRITDDLVNNQITVPPTETAEKWEKPDDWKSVRVEVLVTPPDRGENRTVGHNIKVLGAEFQGWGFEGEEAFRAYQGLRQKLDELYAISDKYPDSKNPAINLPKVIIELRADGDTEYRVVQEVIQILTDSVNPEAYQPTRLLVKKIHVPDAKRAGRHETIYSYQLHHKKSRRLNNFIYQTDQQTSLLRLM